MKPSGFVICVLLFIAVFAVVYLRDKRYPVDRSATVPLPAERLLADIADTGFWKRTMGVAPESIIAMPTGRFILQFRGSGGKERPAVLSVFPRGRDSAFVQLVTSLSFSGWWKEKTEDSGSIRQFFERLQQRLPDRR